MAKSNDVHLEPTAPLACPVLYYKSGEEDGNPIAAVVTRVEDVGRVTLCVFRPHAIPEHYRNVPHISHENLQARRRAGAWKFVDFIKPQGIYDLAREREAKRKAMEKQQADQLAAIRRQEDARKELSEENEPKPV